MLRKDCEGRGIDIEAEMRVAIEHELDVEFEMNKEKSIMTAVETFINKTTTATKARSKEIRISLQEAQILSTELAAMLAKENKLLDKIIKLQDTTSTPINTSLPSGDVVMDGGSFK